MDKVIVLAAGKGTRMDSELPKVLVPIKGRPMISYLIEEIIKSGVCAKPIIVVSPDNKELIKEALKDFTCDYVVQTEQLGTGHAFASAKSLIPAETENIIGLYGDHPFVKAESIRKLLEEHEGVLTMMITKVKDFEGWHKNFYHWGRIVRNNKVLSFKKPVKAIIEFKDATDEEKKITEVNPSFFCFDNKWLWENIDKLKNKNNQQEYYLTDLVKIAFDQNHKIHTLTINPKEAIGVNSKEELEVAENIA